MIIPHIYYYYQADDTGAKLDISRDVKSWKIDEEDNCIKVADVKLRSPAGKYAPTTNVGNGLQYDYDIKIAFGANEVFHGYLVEKVSSTDGEIDIKFASYTNITTKKMVECWRRFRTNESIYTMLTRVDGYELIYGCKDMFKIALSASGVKSDDVTTKAYPFIMFSDSDTVFTALQKLARLVGYRFWVEKQTIGTPPWYTLKLYFRPKNDTIKTYYHGTASTTYLVQHGDDRAPGHKGNIIKNIIKKNKLNYANKVVVYGNKDLNIISESGLPVDVAAAEMVVSDSSLSSDPEAQKMGDMYLAESGIEWYEGDTIVSADRDGAIYPGTDEKMSVIDSEAGIPSTTWRIARNITTWALDGWKIDMYIDKPAFSIAKDRMKIERDLKVVMSSLKSKQNTGDAVMDTEANAETCSTLATDTETLSDDQYAALIDGQIIGSAPNPGEIEIDWDVADDRPTTALPDSVFVEYQIGYNDNVWGPVLETDVSSPLSYKTGHWTIAHDGALSNILTTTTTITGLFSHISYFLRLFMRIQDGKDPTWVWSNEIRVDTT